MDKGEVQKLTGANWQIWKLLMIDILYQKECESPITEGKAQKPASIDDDAWKKIDRKALSYIRPCLSDEILYTVAEETTAEGLWTKLVALYEQASGLNKVFVMRRLFRLKMKENSTMAQHLSEFNSCFSQLKSLSVSLHDEVKALLLLSCIV